MINWGCCGFSKRQDRPKTRNRKTVSKIIHLLWHGIETRYHDIIFHTSNYRLASTRPQYFLKERHSWSLCNYASLFNSGRKNDWTVGTGAFRVAATHKTFRGLLMHEMLFSPSPVKGDVVFVYSFTWSGARCGKKPIYSIIFCKILQIKWDHSTKVCTPCTENPRCFMRTMTAR